MHLINPSDGAVRAARRPGRNLLADRIHPNARGDQRIAAAVRDLLHAGGAV